MRPPHPRVSGLVGVSGVRNKPTPNPYHTMNMDTITITPSSPAVTIPAQTITIPAPPQLVVDWYGPERAMKMASLPEHLLREVYDDLRGPTFREFAAEKAATLEWVIDVMRIRRMAEDTDTDTTAPALATVTLTVPSQAITVPEPPQLVVDWYGSMARAMETAALPGYLLWKVYDDLRTPTYREFAAAKWAALQWVSDVMRVRRMINW